MKRILIATLCAGALAGALAAPPTPASFSHRAAIGVSAATPFHQLALPLAVYQGAQRADLADLRVFNGAGEQVPHALLRPEASAVAEERQVPVPLFPITASAAAPDQLTVQVRRNGDDTLVSVRQPPAAAAGALVRGVVLDVSRTPAGELHALRLQLGAADGAFHPFTLETSDDLQHWRILRDDAQMVKMEHGGQRIDNDSVSWDGPSGKYLRLLWDTPESAPPIQAALVSATRTNWRAAPMLWSAPLAPVQSQDSRYEYLLPGRMPLERLRIGLPQTNTLVPVAVEEYVDERARHARPGRWIGIAQVVAYRLQSPQGDATSPDVVLNGAPRERLRLAVDTRSGGLGALAPTVQVGFVPHTLVFLARGAGPFSLAWGAPDAPQAALPLATLVPGYRGDRPLAAAPATLAAPDTVAGAPALPASPAPVAQKPLSKGILWAVLVLGVLVLGGMAAMLLKQMKGKDEPRPH